MTASERRIVHLRVKELPGVATRSEGDEPNRYVVIEAEGVSGEPGGSPATTAGG